VPLLRAQFLRPENKVKDSVAGSGQMTITEPSRRFPLRTGDEARQGQGSFDACTELNTSKRGSTVALSLITLR
jgi:hypothetical protein